MLIIIGKYRVKTITEVQFIKPNKLILTYIRNFKKRNKESKFRR